MNFRNYPILKILLPYILGIFIGYFSFFVLEKRLLIIIIAMILLLISFVLYHKLSHNRQWLAILILQMSYLWMGFLITEFQFNAPMTKSTHDYILNNSQWGVHIIENPVEKNKSVKVIVSVEKSLSNQTIKKKAILYFKKDRKALALQYGDFLLIDSRLTLIEGPKNPEAFNHKLFMQRKGICYTGYVSPERWQLITHQVPNQIQYYAYRIQQIFSSFFSKAGMEDDEYDIITAILLGNDDTMEPELKNAYAAAGVSHILCVSGMHVGIIFMIVNFLLKPLELFKQTRIVKSFLLLAIIWLYAHITGLSPSVCRAATMFTFVTIGEWGHRNTDTFHSLFTSLFILLLLKPLLLFELGFQLSYLAVFGIVFYQKPLACAYSPKTKVGLYLWQLVTVSVAAQLATFPLSIYYFGQFPNYFLLANLSVITLSFVVVLTGVLLLAVSCVSFLNTGVAWLLTGEIKIMNLIIRTIEGLPGAVMQNISVTELEVLLLYLFFLLLFIAFSRKKKKIFFASLLVLLSYSVSKGYHKGYYMAQENHTFYSIPNILAINFNDHGNSILLSDSITDKKHRQYSFCIQNHERKEYIHSLMLPLDSLCFQNDFLCKRGNFICFAGKKFYILAARQKLYPVREKIKVDYLVIRGNPSLSLEKVKEAIDFSEILIDENNSRYYFNKYINIR